MIYWNFESTAKSISCIAIHNRISKLGSQSCGISNEIFICGKLFKILHFHLSSLLLSVKITIIPGLIKCGNLINCTSSQETIDPDFHIYPRQTIIKTIRIIQMQYYLSPVLSVMTWCQILCTMRLQCVSKILTPCRMLHKT